MTRAVLPAMENRSLMAASLLAPDRLRPVLVTIRHPTRHPTPQAGGGRIDSAETTTLVAIRPKVKRVQAHAGGPPAPYD